MTVFVITKKENTDHYPCGEENEMRTFKKIAAIALVAALSLASAMTAIAAANEEKTAYSFTYEKQQVIPGEAADKALEKLGKYNSEHELTNCADSTGKDMSYKYDSFEVITGKVDGKEIMKELTIIKDDVATEEGLKVGDKPADVKRLYPGIKGDLGLYTITLGNTKLIIDCGLNDDKVVAITYSYAAAK